MIMYILVIKGKSGGEVSRIYIATATPPRVPKFYSCLTFRLCAWNFVIGVLTGWVYDPLWEFGS